MIKKINKIGVNHGGYGASNTSRLIAMSGMVIDRFFRGPHLVWLFLAFALPACVFLAIATPPFQTPDAPNHFFRAYQVSRGVLIGHHLSNSSGGEIDSGVVQFGQFEAPLKFHAEKKWDQDLEQKARAARFTFAEVPTTFGNTAPYPPINYLPQALAFRILANSQGGLMSVYHLACLLNAICAIVLTSVALLLSRRTRAAIFVTSLLPMTLSLMASVSQDATLIPLAFITIAWFDRLAERAGTIDRRDMAIISLLLVCVAIARIPYIALSLLIFYPRIRFDESCYLLRRRLVWSVSILLVCALIYSVQTHLASGNMRTGRSMGGQTAYLLSHISDLPGLMYRTFAMYGCFYVQTFIGLLGWLDTAFPMRYYIISQIVVVLSIVYAGLMPSYNNTTGFRAKLEMMWPWGIFIASSALIFYGLYAFWSEVGAREIEGVQGRYFLPIFPLVGLGMIPSFSDGALRCRLTEWIRGSFVIIFCVFPFVTYFEIVAVVLRRFYIG